MLSAASLLSESALRHPDRLAVALDPRRLSYRELWNEALTAAAALQRRGVAPGDRVALLLPNDIEFPVAYYAVLAAGGVVVPIHALLKAHEIVPLLQHAGAKLLLASGALWPAGCESAASAGIDIWDPSDRGGQARLPRAESRSGEDTAAVLYTSGTTGAPKGAELTHSNLVLNALISATQLLRLSPADAVLGALPLFHAFGQTSSMNSTFAAGASLWLMSRFSGPAALTLMREQAISVFAGVPTMYLALLEAARLEQLPPPRLRLAVSGGPRCR